MLPLADIARLNKDLAALETHLASCTDSGIRRVIEDWIGEAKKKLAEAKKDS